MRLAVEIGRFFVTALAVSITLPAIAAILSMLAGGTMSSEAFFAGGAIIFVMALVGGIIIGLPALWFAHRRQWHRHIGKLATLGTVTGAFGAMLLSGIFWQGNFEIIIPSLIPWAGMGAAAGLVSAVVWYWLHIEDWERAGIA